MKSLRRLAELVAGKAAFLRDMVKNALAIDAKSQSEGLSSTQIIKQYQDFKCNTPHAISPDEFADIYAETIAYGLLAARLDDEYPNTFLRSQALDLFPKSNPFLRELFAYIAGPSLDDRLRSAIDDICDLFQSTDMLTILRNPCEIRGQQDPFLHFCEAFLAKYNPARRKSRGVWHTPKPVVSFIVRSVDELLKNEFGLPDGLADASMIESDPDLGECANRMQPILTSQSNHRVQILDPATGPGTFLAEVMEFIAERVKDSAPEQWASYIDNDLIPRIHGYELLVASYAMCHIKLQMTLAGLGYKPSNNPPPYRVYLTNTLENGENVVQTMFGLSHTIPRDARIMSEIERKTPILCVIGNPPYSGESENNGHWIMDLMECYKKEPGGLQKLQERNSKWINDDYVKFIRFAEHMIATTGEGILGFVTNHGYLDNPTFRGMRWHLMNCFDRIYLLDLHGNSKKKEVSPNGSPDKNLFDISQGVAIIVAVKRRRANGTEKPLAELRYGELWGTREQKFEALARGTISTLAEAVLPPNAPQFPFVARNFSAETEYEKGFSVVDLMPTNSVGIVTARDDLTIDMDRDALWARVQDFYETDVETLRTRYNLGKDARDWSVERAKADVIANYSRSNLTQVAYRPFDHRWTYHTGNQRGFQSYPRVEVMRHFTTPLAKPSASGTIGLVFTRTVEGSRSFADVIVQNIPITLHYLSIKEGNYIAPLHLFPQDGDIDQTTRVNMDPALFEQIRVAAGLAAPFSRDR
ncbi:MAG: hypothetical protein FWD57_12100, partial [Polyangiaceae bacterium]|nr:hypothetical protein [Polyangiaceae bacterium]